MLLDPRRRSTLTSSQVPALVAEPVTTGFPSAARMAETTRDAAKKTRDGVPIWDNNPDTFQDYEDRSVWWEKSLKPIEKKQAVAKMVHQLSGVPWRVVNDLSRSDREKLCKAGVQELLNFIRTTLIETGVPEVGRRFGEYLGRFHRKPMQPMRLFIQEHRHLQNKVEEAIKKAEKKTTTHVIDYREKLSEMATHQ